MSDRNQQICAKRKRPNRLDVITTYQRKNNQTVCLKGLITRGLSGLIAGAHANCKRAEFSMKTPEPREREEEEEASGRKAAERRGERREGREERINRDIHKRDGGWRKEQQ